MHRLPIFLVLAALSGCASLQPAPPPAPSAQFVVPEGSEFVSNLFGYSQAVRVGPWIMVSAQPGYDVDKRGFPETLAEQAAMAFKNLALVLAASGATLNDVVSLASHQTDMEQFPEVVDARNEAFGEHRPTWTAVGVSALPLAAMQFQISATAYVGPGGVQGAAPPAAVAPAAGNVTLESAEQGNPPRFFNRPGY